MSKGALLSIIIRLFWPVLFSLAAPALADAALALDPGNALLAALADLLNGVASTRPGAYEVGRRLSALEALFT
jgi:hypothetical protein